MFTNSRKISREQNQMASATFDHHTDEMQHIVTTIVQSRRSDGAQRAVSNAARILGFSESRVTEILRGRVCRFWADEMDAARHRYARWCDRQAELLEHEAAMCRARRAEIQERQNARH